MEKGRYDISVDGLYGKHYKNHKGKFYSMRHSDFSPIGDEYMFHNVLVCSLKFILDICYVKPTISNLQVPS